MMTVEKIGQTSGGHRHEPPAPMETATVKMSARNGVDCLLWRQAGALNSGSTSTSASAR